MPLISIGINSYNHAKYITTTLDSILQEDYPHKEIVIVDDGSTDNSVEVIQKWIDKNGSQIPVKLISRPNKGLSISVNELLDNLNGPIIALLASDDALCNNSLSKRLKVLQQTKKMLVVGDCSVIDEHGVITHKSWMKDVMKIDVDLYSTEEGIMKEVLVKPASSGSLLFMDKNIYKKIGRYPKNFHAEDWFFYQRCAAAREMVYIDEIVSLYRRHDTNQSGSELSGRKHLVKSIIKCYRLNWMLFPGFRMKGIAVKQWLKWNYIYLRTYILNK